MKILLVDDDAELIELLTFALQRAGFEVVSGRDNASALSVLRDERPDLAVLDLNLGQESGFDLLRELRERSDIPVILLSGRRTEDDKVTGLELGSDDYLTKPFGHRELIARIRAHLRRSAPDWSAPTSGAHELHAGQVHLDTREHSVTLNGAPVRLTATEFRLLHLLMSNAGAVVPFEAVLKRVWNDDDAFSRSAVRTTVHRLRRKLEPDRSDGRLIHTITGVGIMLKFEPPPSSLER